MVRRTIRGRVLSRRAWRLIMTGLLVLAGAALLLPAFAVTVEGASKGDGLTAALGVVALVGVFTAFFLAYIRFVTGTPVGVAVGMLPTLIGRVRCSLGWKFLAAISLVVLSFLMVSFVTFGGMDFMHDRLHEIQGLTHSQPDSVPAAIDELGDTQHGLLFSLTPVLGSLGVLLSLGLGLAVAWSVIGPIRKMERGMCRIASGDFSQPVVVDNRDELGDLAGRINQTAIELGRLQKATVAAERDRALRERIAQVTLAQEEERRRISRELHDGLGPSLAAIGNTVRICRGLVRTDPDRAEREMEEITKLLTGHVREIRELIYDLRPLSLDQLGLGGALRQQLERLGREARVETSFESSGEVSLDPLTEVTIFRVVQECLRNVQKHSGAGRVEVWLRTLADGVEVGVRDDGRGFDAGNAGSTSIADGMGLQNIRERAELLGARVSVESSEGSGCKVTLRHAYSEVEVGANHNSAGG